MIWRPGLHVSDVVILTWWDLVLLALGRRLRDGGCEVVRVGVHNLKNRSVKHAQK